MKTRKLGADLEVSAIGLGCMGMTHAYGGQPEAESIATLRRAVDLGVTLFDTAEMYGPFTNELVVGKGLAPVRDQVVIATKFGFRIVEDGHGGFQAKGTDSRPEHLKKVCEASLKRLGVDVIDLFYQHRVDPAVPIEDTVGAMADLVREGKVRALGLSEAGAATIERAHKVHPIAAVQSEYSLWTRDPEPEVLPTLKRLGITLVPYSPLGRGFLTGALRARSQLGQDDFRRGLPRFDEANMEANQGLVDTVIRLAETKGVTPAQLALAWVLAQGDAIVPIPGARKIPHLEDNVGAVDVELTAADLAEIEEALPPVAGARYPEQWMNTVNR